MAPSPTGALHLGNARTFLINWALAKQRGWEVVLRIEDLDTPRTKPGASEQAIEDLRWLGMTWDDGPFTQVSDLTPYETALGRLDRAGRSYRCPATRREIVAAASAPHADQHELRYPGLYRPTPAPGSQAGKNGTVKKSVPPPPIPDGAATAVRVIVPDEAIDFEDELHGPQSVNVQQHVGDFVIASKAGLPAYQLAVVVDDARQGVTDVVRGDDLLRSTARQVLLYRLLGLGVPPRYVHLPLVLGPDGHRLAKRHGDTQLSWYREQGVPAERVIALLARWSGIVDETETMEAATFARCFSLDTLPREPVTMAQGDDAWLLEKT